MKQRFTLTAALVVGVLMLVPAFAQAHVTVQPKTTAAGGFTRIDVRVPNEDPKAATTNIKVQFPSGIFWTSYQPVPGWTVKVTQRKLAKPVEMHGESISEETDSVEFKATGDGIRPGQFQDFGLSINTPDTPGSVLKFPAVQTYSNGEVVRWIGDADSEKPAATVTLTASADAHASHGDDNGDDAGDDDSEGTSTVAWIALALGGLGLILGAAAFARTRRNG